MTSAEDDRFVEREEGKLAIVGWLLSRVNRRASLRKDDNDDDNDDVDDVSSRESFDEGDDDDDDGVENGRNLA